MLPAAAGAGGSWRRLVAGTDSTGRSTALVDGPAPVVYEPGGPGGVSLVELWQTGGLPQDPGAGGDPSGAWELEPRNGGIAFRAIEMPPGIEMGEAGRRRVENELEWRHEAPKLLAAYQSLWSDAAVSPATRSVET
jgi:hypothetical protein